MASLTDAVVGLQEQNAAVRRLTRLISQDTELDVLFDAVVSEVARILDASACLLRHDADGSTTAVASLGDPALAKGSRRPDGGSSRLDLSVTSAVVVDGVMWGTLCARSPDPPPPDAEAWLADVAELVSIAVSAASSRVALRRLAGEQAAVRHVATLVAEGSSLSDLFAAVARAVAQAVDADAIAVERIDADRSATVIASLDAPRFPIGSRWPIVEPGLHASVMASGRPVRVADASVFGGARGAALRDSAIRSLVAAPVVVSGALWGLMWVGGKRAEPLPAVTETRLRDFAEFAAVAVANAESRNRLRRLADSEASLRRVATLSAEGATPEELLAAVADEAARILDGSTVAIVRYDADDAFEVVAAHNDPVFEIGSTWPVEDSSLAAAVRETKAPVRDDDFVGAPIVVDGDVWGMIVVRLRQPREALPRFTAWYTSRMLSSSVQGEEIESRLASFTELVGTAISRAEAHAEVIASRARIVEAGDEAMRRIERDLHDGTQQRLVALALHLQRVRADVPAEERDTHAGDRAAGARAEIGDRRGAGVVARRAPGAAGGGRASSLRCVRSPGALRFRSTSASTSPNGRLHRSRLLSTTSSPKRSPTRSSTRRQPRSLVTVALDSGAIRVTVADDGVGGAQIGAGSGLTGLSDRVDALAGRFEVVSPAGGGTTISVELPVAAP